MNKRLLLEPAQKNFERAQKLEQEFIEYFTGTCSMFVCLFSVYFIDPWLLITDQFEVVIQDFR